jgi:hypothetical protein
MGRTEPEHGHVGFLVLEDTKVLEVFKGKPGKVETVAGRNGFFRVPAGWWPLSEGVGDAAQFPSMVEDGEAACR